MQRGSFVCSFVAGHVHSRVAPLVCACTRPITPPPYTMIVLESESAREGKCGLVLRRRLHARTVTTLCMLWQRHFCHKNNTSYEMYERVKERERQRQREREIGVYWYLFSNHRTRKCIHKNVITNKGEVILWYCSCV